LAASPASRNNPALGLVEITALRVNEMASAF
jgi:CelD/BcsL family acetyltransferase involved in cellulose biosynthesis